jgi:hypothetical protein
MRIAKKAPREVAFGEPTGHEVATIGSYGNSAKVKSVKNTVRKVATENAEASGYALSKATFIEFAVHEYDAVEV